MTHQKDHYRRVNGKTIYVPDAEEASEQAEGREVAKAHVKGHVRIVDGKVILIAAHETKAPGRVAKLHERTALGEHKTKGNYLRAMEQYFGAVTGKPLANSQGNHPTHDDFAKHVQPLIAEFLATRGPILKALQDLSRPA